MCSVRNASGKLNVAKTVHKSTPTPVTRGCQQILCEKFHSFSMMMVAPSWPGSHSSHSIVIIGNLVQQSSSGTHDTIQQRREAPVRVSPSPVSEAQSNCDSKAVWHASIHFFTPGSVIGRGFPFLCMMLRLWFLSDGTGPKPFTSRTTRRLGVAAVRLQDVSVSKQGEFIRLHG